VLTSLFGDLSNPAGKRTGSDEPTGFAATAILESVATEVNAQGQMVDRHSHDLVVTGSPAQAIRDHFADTRADLDTATSLITLLDPTGVWAPAVIKALSDAGGRPIERLHLRENTTLRTLALIERTTLVRRHEDALRIYHADVRAPGPENAEIPVALMERSQMTTVIIGAMQPHAIDALLLALLAATSIGTWRCPNLLFMLPPNAVWIANKVHAIGWPEQLRVHVLSESMTSASSVWNAMLGMWNQVKLESVADIDPTLPLLSLNEVAAPGPSARGPAPGATPPNALDPARARQALATMLTLDGLLGCAIVDSASGLALARELREDQPVDIELAAAACTQVLRMQRQVARNMGLSEHIDEILISAGPRQQIMRTVSRHPDLFLVVLLDKQRTNLALARFQLAEVERGLY
jgi:predicted regulator of Ras-like GTPase activity (Roadblock/LC7/MglB family)